jgi:putative transcriptional regulator
MPHDEMKGLKAPEAIMKEAGFEVSARCFSRPSCFDYAARKDKTILLVKVQLDIDNFSQADSKELITISNCISASVLLISEKTREKPLEDDTVYSRYSISAITSKTFENIILRGMHPLIQAGPGGYYVEIDCAAIKRRRQELGLSVGEMAQMIGASRRTLYGYERGMTKASVAAAYNLIRALGVPIAKPVNIFEKPKKQNKHFIGKAGNAAIRNKFLKKIFRKFASYNIAAIKKAPFDFLVNVPEEKVRIIGGVASNRERSLERRVEEILSVSKVINAHPVLITDGQKPLNKEISCVPKEELTKMRNPEDLLL